MGILVVLGALVIFVSGFATSALINNQKRTTIPEASSEANIVNTQKVVKGEKSDQSLQTQSPVSAQDFKVVRVIDGDTVEIEGGQKIRYIGIDTPETVHPDKSVQCFGKEASAKNKELVLGKSVSLEKDISQTDKYGRLLRYVYVGDVFVNDYLVRQGFAKSSSYPPDIKHQEEFRQAELEAGQNNRGLWSQCRPGVYLPITSAETSAPNECQIKGNISSSGEKIYHVPGQRYWDKTQIDESKGEHWFCTEEEAASAGFRKSKV